MAEGILTSLKKKFNELGNERLMELYEVQSLYGDITNQINSEGSKVSMVVEPDEIDSFALADDIKSNIDSINELDNGPTKDFEGETFYNLDDPNSVYNFDYSMDELQTNIPETEIKDTISSNDYNFSEIADENVPEELTDVPTEENVEDIEKSEDTNNTDNTDVNITNDTDEENTDDKDSTDSDK